MSIIQLNISIELLAPKTEDGVLSIVQTAQTLASINPQFFSVTYGAGGSSQAFTLKTIQQLKENLATELMPHLTCIGTTPTSASQQIANYQKLGITRIMVARGDVPPQDKRPLHFPYAVNLVEFIHDIAPDVDVTVAAYPAINSQDDTFKIKLEYLKAKVNAGAKQAITQYFYDIQAYENLLEACAQQHITIPIIPGILPITDYDQLMRITTLTGEHIPKKIMKKIEKYKEDPASLQQFGIDLVTELCEKLITLDVKQLHFYTLNNAKNTLGILSNLGIHQN